LIFEVAMLTEKDSARTQFLRGCLSHLGLKVSKEASSVPSLSRLHLSSLHHIEVSELLEDLKEILTIEDDEEYINGENDTFHIEKKSSRWSINSLVRKIPRRDYIFVSP
jgi:biotin--protein ligase